MTPSPQRIAEVASSLRGLVLDGRAEFAALVRSPSLAKDAKGKPLAAVEHQTVMNTTVYAVAARVDADGNIVDIAAGEFRADLRANLFDTNRGMSLADQQATTPSKEKLAAGHDFDFKKLFNKVDPPHAEQMAVALLRTDGATGHTTIVMTSKAPCGSELANCQRFLSNFARSTNSEVHVFTAKAGTSLQTSYVVFGVDGVKIEGSIDVAQALAADARKPPSFTDQQIRVAANFTRDIPSEIATRRDLVKSFSDLKSRLTDLSLSAEERAAVEYQLAEVSVALVERGVLDRQALTEGGSMIGRAVRAVLRSPEVARVTKVALALARVGVAIFEIIDPPLTVYDLGKTSAEIYDVVAASVAAGEAANRVEADLLATVEQRTAEFQRLATVGGGHAVWQVLTYQLAKLHEELIDPRTGAPLSLERAYGVGKVISSFSDVKVEAGLIETDHGWILRVVVPITPEAVAADEDGTDTGTDGEASVDPSVAQENAKPGGDDSATASTVYMTGADGSVVTVLDEVVILGSRNARSAEGAGGAAGAADGVSPDSTEPETEGVAVGAAREASGTVEAGALGKGHSGEARDGDGASKQPTDVANAADTDSDESPADANYSNATGEESQGEVRTSSDSTQGAARVPVAGLSGSANAATDDETAIPQQIAVPLRDSQTIFGGLAATVAGDGADRLLAEIARRASEPYRSQDDPTPAGGLTEQSFEIAPSQQGAPSAGPYEPAATIQSLNPDGSVAHTRPDLGASVTFYDGSDGVHPKGAWSESTQYPGEAAATEMHLPGADVVDVVVQQDRSVTWLKRDGATEIHYRDGTSLVTRPDHSSTILRADGSVTEVHADRSSDTYRPWDDSHTRTDPQGASHTTFPGGESWDDGHGSSHARYDDGRTSETVTHHDHSSTTTWNDGTRVDHAVDRTSVTHNPTDGSVTTRYPDFHEKTEYADKHVVVRGGDGGWTTYYTDGSRDINRWVSDHTGDHLSTMHVDAQGHVSASGFGKDASPQGEEQRQLNWEGRQAPSDGTAPVVRATSAAASVPTATGSAGAAQAEINLPPMNSFHAYAPSRAAGGDDPHSFPVSTTDVNRASPSGPAIASRRPSGPDAGSKARQGGSSSVGVAAAGQALRASGGGSGGSAAAGPGQDDDHIALEVRVNEVAAADLAAAHKMDADGAASIGFGHDLVRLDPSTGSDSDLIRSAAHTEHANSSERISPANHPVDVATGDVNHDAGQAVEALGVVPEMPVVPASGGADVLIGPPAPTLSSFDYTGGLAERGPDAEIGVASAADVSNIPAAGQLAPDHGQTDVDNSGQSTGSDALASLLHQATNETAHSNTSSAASSSTSSSDSASAAANDNQKDWHQYYT